ncbi:hypothetical protein N9Y26_00575 [bacterium]|nr:hypothetical protein [bacterium]
MNIEGMGFFNVYASGHVIAGMTACLWQAHDDKSNIEIIDAIIRMYRKNKQFIS